MDGHAAFTLLTGSRSLVAASVIHESRFAFAMKDTDHVSFRLKEFLTAYLPRGVQGRGCRVRTRSVDECQRLKNRRGGRCSSLDFESRVWRITTATRGASASNTGRIPYSH